jgi:hypothetical protein
MFFFKEINCDDEIDVVGLSQYKHLESKLSLISANDNRMPITDIKRHQLKTEDVQNHSNCNVDVLRTPVLEESIESSNSPLRANISSVETAFNRKSFSIDSLLFSAKQRHLRPPSLSSVSIVSDEGK